MNAAHRRVAHGLRDERGFTLIELMVGALAGAVVSMAAGAIVIVSIHLSTNFTDRIDANQQGRVAMEKITQALNSSCVAASVPPVIAGSDDNNAIFVSALSDAATINPSELKVSLTGGSLITYTYSYASGAAPNWVFTGYPASPATSFVLLPHAAQATINGSVVPVFRYYGYTNGVLSTTAFTTPLSAANAAATAMITVSFQAKPSNGNTTGQGRAANLTSSVVLRLTAASAAANGSGAVCA